MIRIVCASPDIYLEDFDASDYVIAVDGGLDYLLAKNIKPNVVIGDFDSTTSLEYLNYDYKKYPSRKDETDFELALGLVKDKTEEVRVYGALGGRFDHMMVNLRLIRKNIILIDKTNKIYQIEGKVNLKKDEYKYISFINLHEDAKISLKGFKYDLDNYTLTSHDTLCVSNEIINNGQVFVDRPILVIESK